MSTREEIDARVMERGDIPSSEKLRWMGRRIGNVVKVCRRTK